MHIQIKSIEGFDLGFSRSIDLADISELSHCWAAFIEVISQGRPLKM